MNWFLGKGRRRVEFQCVYCICYTDWQSKKVQGLFTAYCDHEKLVETITELIEDGGDIISVHQIL